MYEVWSMNHEGEVWTVNFELSDFVPNMNTASQKVKTSSYYKP